MSDGTRPPAAAGRFYPGQATELARAVDGLLAAATAHGPPGHAIVVPHAGYAYSGPVAASGYAVLRERRDDLRRVAILGPAHFVGLAGAAVPAADAWATPLGEVPIDVELRAAALACGALVDDAPHRPEHAVEVQLPFLQRLCATCPGVLPVTVGESSAEQAAALVAALWEIADAVVVSTDLSHYLDHASARALDRRTAAAIVARRADLLGSHHACGVHALRGLVAFAARVGARVRLLDLRTSADTAGGRARVVGYGAFAVG